MKVVITLCVLALISWSAGKPQSRDCNYDEERCYEECEEGTHSYTPSCGPMTPEATCENPNPVARKGTFCDYSSCYCDAPTVRDTVSGKCVKLKECPKKP